MASIEVTCTLDTQDGIKRETKPENFQIVVRSHLLYKDRVRLKVGNEERVVLARDLIEAVERASFR